MIDELYVMICVSINFAGVTLIILSAKTGKTAGEAILT